MLLPLTRMTALFLFIMFLFPLVPLISASLAVELPMNDINIVVVTDVHAWVGSRKRHEPQWDADYGHVVSFYEHLRDDCLAKQHNLLFVMNGDFTDGTGLSAYPPSHLTPILQKMPWDALNIGNHELYANSTVQHIVDGGFAEFWGAKYVTSNVLRASDGDSLEPLGGGRHLLWKSPTATVLIFGFLYDMTDSSPLVVVEPVEKVVEQEWFASALNDDFDAVVCLVHMDVKDALISVILAKIRSVSGNSTAVHFISGHSHVRAFEQIDEYSASFEAGHYLDTIGFLSFATDGAHVQHVFIDASVDTLQSIIGADDFMTDNGTEVQNMIRNAQEQLGLLNIVGCSPDHFQIDVELTHPQSLWRLYMKNIITEFFLSSSPTSVYVQSSGGFRYDLYKGQVLLDDLIAVNPFNETIVRLSKELKGSQIIEVLGGRINSLASSVPWLPHLPDYVCSADDIDAERMYQFYTSQFDVPHFVEKLSNMTDELVEFEYLNLSTTSLMIDFVRREWPEGGEHCQPLPNFKNPVLLVGVVCLVTVSIILIVVVVRRKRAVAWYDMALVESEDVLTQGDFVFDDEEFI